MKLLLILLISLSTLAKINVKWMGITGIILDDGDTTLLFDPVVTRASLFDFITFRDIQSDKDLVSFYSHELRIKNVKAIFISHSHADHSIDVAQFARLSDAFVFGSETTKNIALGYGLKKDLLRNAKHGDKIKAGEFEVDIYETIHAPLIFGLNFAEGTIKSPLEVPSSFYSYKMGKNYMYHVKHPQGSILIHPGAAKSPLIDDYKKLKADTLILGIASRESDEYMLENIIAPVSPRRIIPTHIDNFFKPIPADRNLPISGSVNLDDFKNVIQKKYEVIVPKFGKTITLED